MTSAVKRARAYDVTTRRKRTHHRRTNVLYATLELMSENGYMATTVASIAMHASVSVEFIYKHFRDKVGLAAQTLDLALAGDDKPLPMNERPHVQHMIAEPNAREVLALYARHAAAVNSRAGAFLIAIASAAPSETQLAALWKSAQANRLAGARALVGDIGAKARLATVTDCAADVVWALIGPENYSLLVGQREWEVHEYTAWLTQSLIHALLGAPTESPPD